MNNRTYIPLRFTGEALGGIVEYDQESATVNVISRDELLEYGYEHKSTEKESSENQSLFDIKLNTLGELDENNKETDHLDTPEIPDIPEF
ncbi:stalk domain-containing protein [Natranaerobius trueperi]|uniref:Copper amine oxidase-like N-terminal domain-containing protein n=1 Tax=Natranaerobius trueperi TaxID=759412 RepID=A0A226BXJ4_9FIRM|nr:stalk domain-containing protein [Natranaerobius trueperi]OWZ82837.1 hypothetical protein CDO51_11920 [Natranaerobius trueperi]